MKKIHLLPDDLINKIAAGEVVERPASVVKELMENALDAGATDIRIDVTDGGKTSIRIQDNGSGMSTDDARLAFERHATSKIRDFSDLERLSSLGFRGEALPSIASVSKVHLVTSDGDGPEGTEILLEGGAVQEIRAAGRGRGTTIEVRDLFFNTPARRKFLKSPPTELSHISGTVSEISLAHPEVHFVLRHNGRSLIKTPGVDSILERAGQLFGKGLEENLMAVEEGREGLHLFGFVSIPGYSRPSGTALNFFINRRPIKDKTLRHAVYDAYETLLMRGRHPVVYLFLDLDPALVDFNVHPSKREVRFSDVRMIHNYVRDGVRKAVQEYGRTPVHEPSPIPEKAERMERVHESVETYFRNLGNSTPQRRMELVRNIPRSEPYRTEEVRTSPPVQALFEDRLTPIGQIADSFIITQDREGLILVDQHAAHERVLYEKFKQQYRQSRIPVQRLLIPVNVDLSKKETILLEEQIDFFQRLGIEMDDLGHGTYAVKGVPSWVVDVDITELVQALLQEIDSLEQAGEVDRQIENVIHLFSCRAAVKSHRSMKKEEMETLLRELSNTESPHTCEHGRPTMIRIDLQEIERRFKRH